MRVANSAGLRSARPPVRRRQVWRARSATPSVGCAWMSVRRGGRPTDPQRASRPGRPAWTPVAARADPGSRGRPTGRDAARGWPSPGRPSPRLAGNVPAEGLRSDCPHCLTTAARPGREQPVVACEVHPAAQGDRLLQQAGAQLAGGLRRHRAGEEQSRVRPRSRPGDLQRSRGTDGASRLDLGQGVQHRRRAVEVRCQPAAAVAVEQGIQPDVDLPGQVRGQDLVGQR